MPEWTVKMVSIPFEMVEVLISIAIKYSMQNGDVKTAMALIQKWDKIKSIQIA